ncbi:hypothetical protein ACOMCU_01120 [Lysinibacillus sp. UGB7]|uniref:hypothetical protein n=1 Tax=Lysinibacillus sp. UGB7 TaxID=3411039 RepID=UPI003B79DD22
MVTEEMLFSKQFKFKHFLLEVLEKDEKKNVLVFAANVVTATLPGQGMSAGHIEINRTLWNQDSPKRPEGYWVLGSPEQNGIMKSVFVSDEWLENTPKDIQNQKRAEWGV